MTPDPSGLSFTTIPHVAPFGTTGRHYTGQASPVKGISRGLRALEKIGGRERRRGSPAVVSAGRGGGSALVGGNQDEAVAVVWVLVRLEDHELVDAAGEAIDVREPGVDAGLRHPVPLAVDVDAIDDGAGAPREFGQGLLPDRAVVVDAHDGKLSCLNGNDPAIRD